MVITLADLIIWLIIAALVGIIGEHEADHQADQ